MSRRLDLIGQRFGRLTVLHESAVKISRSGNKERQWFCLCDCGESKVIQQGSLRRGRTLSCGCYSSEATSKRNYRHGMSKESYYHVWSAMIQRCDNPREKHYHLYGGRGITYDLKWKEFTGFWHDMSEGYSNGLTLDRIDPNGNYCKENCRWVSYELQARNIRKLANNKSGVTGVYKGTSGSGYRSWMAEWRTLDGKTKTKSFGIPKYGNEKAFLLACEHRQKEI